MAIFLTRSLVKSTIEKNTSYFSFVDSALLIVYYLKLPLRLKSGAPVCCLNDPTTEKVDR